MTNNPFEHVRVVTPHKISSVTISQELQKLSYHITDSSLVMQQTSIELIHALSNLRFHNHGLPQALPSVRGEITLDTLGSNAIWASDVRSSIDLLKRMCDTLEDAGLRIGNQVCSAEFIASSLKKHLETPNYE